jgi:hypothetical protein
MKYYWEIVADRLSKAGWSLGWVLAVDSEGRTIWIVDAHGYGKRFIVRADCCAETGAAEKLTAFPEFESATPQNAIDTPCRFLTESHSR